MIPLIVIRPEPGCSATLRAAHDAGLPVHGFPMFAVEPVAWDAPPREAVDAVLIGSANALRHGGAALDTYRGLPAYVVGEATAAAARAAGFPVAMTGTGGLQAVLDGVPSGRLLRLGGRERIVLHPPAGVSIIERTVYASNPVPMPPELSAMLGKPAVVLLHSAEAARHFAAECDRLGIVRDGIALGVIGPRVAAAAGAGWAVVDCAERPDDQALLALAGRLCQTARQQGTD